VQPRSFDLLDKKAKDGNLLTLGFLARDELSSKPGVGKLQEVSKHAFSRDKLLEKHFKEL